MGVGEVAHGAGAGVPSSYHQGTPRFRMVYGMVYGLVQFGSVEYF